MKSNPFIFPLKAFSILTFSINFSKYHIEMFPLTSAEATIFPSGWNVTAVTSHMCLVYDFATVKFSILLRTTMFLTTYPNHFLSFDKTKQEA